MGCWSGVKHPQTYRAGRGCLAAHLSVRLAVAVEVGKFADPISLSRPPLGTQPSPLSARASSRGQLSYITEGLLKKKQLKSHNILFSNLYLEV